MKFAVKLWFHERNSLVVLQIHKLEGQLWLYSYSQAWSEVNGWIF